MAPKQQFNIRLETGLIEALRTRAESEGITLTDLIARFCEQGLGLPTEGSRPIDLEAIYSRIAAQVEELIPQRIEERIAEQLAPIQRELAARNDALGESSA